VNDKSKTENIVKTDTDSWRHQVYADIRGLSLERRRQTTVGSRVNAGALLSRASWHC